MSAAARGLSHERRALQHLQVVAELLRPGPRCARRQHIHRLVRQIVSSNRRTRPRLDRGRSRNRNQRYRSPEDIRRRRWSSSRWQSRKVHLSRCRINCQRIFDGPRS
jgi:hypothetical protein